MRSTTLLLRERMAREGVEEGIISKSIFFLLFKVVYSLAFSYMYIMRSGHTTPSYVPLSPSTIVSFVFVIHQV